MATLVLVGGKGVVSLYESGKRIPDAATVDRYAAVTDGELTVLRSLRDAAIRSARTRAPGSSTAPEGVAPVPDHPALVSPTRSRRRVLVSAGAAVVALIAGGVAYVLATSANGQPRGEVRITEPHRNQMVGYPTPLRGTVTGYRGWDLWLDIQSTDERRHHTTDASCPRNGSKFSFSDIYLGNAEDHHVAFRVSVVAVKQDSTAQAALIRYADRNHKLPNAYRGTTKLPTGSRVVSSIRLVRR